MTAIASRRRPIKQIRDASRKRQLPNPPPMPYRRWRSPVRAGAFAARLDAGRRHRLRQGPPGRRHHSRPLAARPPPGAVAVRLRQASRGRPPRLGRDRRQRGRPHPIGQVPPGGRYSSRGRNPVRHLCNLALARPSGKVARASNRSSAGSRTGWTRTSRHAFDGVIVFDEAHAMANAAGSKGSRGDTGPSQQGRAGLRLQNASARCPYTLCLRHRGHHRARPGPMRGASGSGAARDSGRRDALRATHRLRHRHGGRRGRGDGGGGPRSEGPRALPGPCAQL